MLCNVKNPTRAIRVIYDGFETKSPGPGVPRPDQKKYTIMPGEEKAGIELHETIVNELKARNEKKANSDLIVTVIEPVPASKQKAAAA